MTRPLQLLPLILALATPALAQTTRPLNPAYLSELPTIETILKDNQSSNPELQRQQQVAAIFYLRKIVTLFADAHDTLTPDEADFLHSCVTANTAIVNTLPTAEARAAFEESIDKSLTTSIPDAFLKKYFSEIFRAKFGRIHAAYRARMDAEFLAGMPTVEHVMKVMKVDDPEKSRLRQSTAMYVLTVLMHKNAASRIDHPELTPEEESMRDAYFDAVNKLEENLNEKEKKTFDDAVAAQFRDKTFSEQLTQQLFASQLTLTVLLPSADGAPKSAANQGFFLLNDDLNDALLLRGFRPPPGTSPRKAMEDARIKNSPELKKAVDAVLADAATPFVTTNAAGKATFAPLPAGTYYLVGGILEPRLAWNLKIQLKPGDNAITLDSKNAAPFDK